MPYAFDDERDPLIYMHLHGRVNEGELQQLLDEQRADKVAEFTAEGAV